MNDTLNTASGSFPLSPNISPESPNVTPGWQKCLTCADYGISCNGPSLGSLGNIDSVRSFHKALKKARKLTLKSISDAAPSISDTTISEYFSNVVKDYKWTTVSAIDTALASICGNRVGALPLENACPASSSEIRSQIAAAELKIAAAELKAAQHENDAAGLTERLAAVKAKHIAQIELLESTHTKDMEWMKNEVRLWRRFAFVLLAVGLALLVGLLISAVFCILALRG